MLCAGGGRQIGGDIGDQHAAADGDAGGREGGGRRGGRDSTRERGKFVARSGSWAVRKTHWFCGYFSENYVPFSEKRKFAARLVEIICN